MKTNRKNTPAPIDLARPYKSQALTKSEAAYARKLTSATRWSANTPCYARSQHLFLSACDFDLTFVGELPLPVPPVPKGMALRYVEGFSEVLSPKTGRHEFRGEHAWLSLNGKVIDVTWRRNGRSIVGEFTGITYFGREFTEDDLIDFFGAGIGGTDGGVPEEYSDPSGWRMIDAYYWGDRAVGDRCIKRLRLSPPSRRGLRR